MGLLDTVKQRQGILCLATQMKGLSVSNGDPCLVVMIAPVRDPACRCKGHSQ
jgi:hypothetical protein